MSRTEEFASGNGQWHGMDKPTYTKHYKPWLDGREERR